MKHIRKITRRTLFRLAALLIGLCFVYLFIRSSDLSAIGYHLGRVGFKFFILALVTAMTQVLATAAWRLTFPKPPTDISFWSMVFIRLIGENVAIVNPTNIIAGEATKAYLLKKRGVPYVDGIASLTLSRFLIVLTGISLILFGVTFCAIQHRSFLLPLIILGGIFLPLISLVITRYRKNTPFISNALGSLVKWWGKSSQAPHWVLAVQKLENKILALKSEQPGRLLAALVLSFLQWMPGAVEFFLILQFLGISASFVSVVAVESGVQFFRTLGAFIPGQLGAEEYGNRLMLGIVVGGSGVWLAASILRRSRQLFWLGISIILSLFYFGKPGRKKSFFTKKFPAESPQL